MSDSRISKSIKNAKVNLIFFSLSLILSFFSRKIFLDYLGAEFIGLTGTLQNLLGFLNLADLGIGASIGYVLYRPIFEKDEKKIIEIISVLGFLYRKVGLLILVSGIILSLFIPFIFNGVTIKLCVIYVVYYGFLLSSILGYFVNYKQTLLGADQKNYIIIGYSQTLNLLKTIIQMFVAYYLTNYYLWIGIELLFNIFYSIILNKQIKRAYPWLQASIFLGKKKYGEYHIIIEKAKQMFVHVLAGVGRNQVLPFLIYTYDSLSIVAYYGNYTILVSKIQMFFDSFLNSTGAGIGNLIAEGDKKKIMEIYWELIVVRFSIAAFTLYSLSMLINPFISLWLGEEYILSDTIINVFLFNIFLSQTRGTTEQFNFGYGLFHDVWAPVATLVITVGVGLIGGYFYGIAGVISGDCASCLLILHLWKPYLLFSEGFKESVYRYWYRLLYVLLILLIVFIVSKIIMDLFINIELDTFYHWTIYAICTTVVFGIVYFSIALICLKPIRTFIRKLYLH